MQSKLANIVMVLMIRSFYRRVRKLDNRVLRYHLAMLMRNR